MKIKILRGGNFGHPNPAMYGRNLYTLTGEIVEVDEEQGLMIIRLGRGTEVDKEKLTEIVGPELTEPSAPDIEEEAPKKRRGRPPKKRSF